MQPTSRLTGKPIVSVDCGDRIGTIADVLIDARRGCAVGLVIDAGFLHGEHVLPFEEVEMLGRDVVIARSGSGLLDAVAWKQRDRSARRASRLKNTRVITRNGRDVGTLSDFYLDDRGAIAAYDLARSDFAGIVRHHANVPHTSEIALGQTLCGARASAVTGSAAPVAVLPRVVG